MGEVKIPKSLIARIERLGKDPERFVKEAVEEKLSKEGDRVLSL